MRNEERSEKMSLNSHCVLPPVALIRTKHINSINNEVKKKVELRGKGIVTTKLMDIVMNLQHQKNFNCMLGVFLSIFFFYGDLKNQVAFCSSVLIF
jgi:hypothetical protein